jgi:hypothetical protein
MFDVHSIIRFTAILFYIGMVVSSITGFIGANNISANEYRVCLITTGLVILLQNMVYLVYEMLRLYDKNQFLITNIFYIRGILILQSSILALGLSDVGLGFGVFGIIMFLINILAGVFIDNSQMRVSTYYSEDNES